MIGFRIHMLYINKLIELAKEAGKIHLHYYQKDNLAVKFKEDESPVSVADLESNELICTELTKLYPDIPIISEENHNQLIDHEIFWLIDPLDGTKSFLNGQGEFTVNIGLIKNKKPISGIVYAPLCGDLYYVDIDNVPYKESTGIIKARSIPEEGLTILVSAFSTNYDRLNSYLEGRKIDKIIPSSSAIKICRIAEGKADLYPRFGRTMEWDTAAGHAILNAAGGSIKYLDGNELSYGHIERAYANPDFIASGN